MKLKILVCVLALSSITLRAQGPPLTSDKPIMLSAKTIVIKTLTEIRHTDAGTYTRAPLMFHYLPTSNWLAAVHVPLVNDKQLDDVVAVGPQLGDVGLLLKYQFYRFDRTGRTLRSVIKSYQQIPTGRRVPGSDINLGVYQLYLGSVTGYETVKYGMSFEFGYNLVPDLNEDTFRMKAGFGLPILKPVYPANQINFLFEYVMNRFTEKDIFELLYTQGVQYARKRFTWEMGVQTPLVQSGDDIINKRKYGLFLGTRFIY